MSAETAENKDKVDQAAADTEKEGAKPAENAKKVLPKKETGKSG